MTDDRRQTETLNSHKKRFTSFYMQIIKIKRYSNKLNEVCGSVW